MWSEVETYLAPYLEGSDKMVNKKAMAVIAKMQE